MKTMQFIWQQLTLSRLSIREWNQSSYLHQIVGLAGAWRKESWLLQWAELIATGFVLLIFGLSPVLSTTWIGLLLLVCGGFWVLLTVSDESGVGVTPIHLTIFLYWGIATIATALSPVRIYAFDGWIKLTLYLLLFALLARLLRSPQIRSVVIGVYLHAALLVSIVGLRQWFFGASALATWVDPESSLAGTTRVYSYLGNPNLLAGYLIPAAIFSGVAIFGWKHWGAKLLAGVMTLVNLACLVLTFSRGGWIGMVAGGFIAVLLLIHWFRIHWSKFWRRWTLPLVLGGSAALLTSAVLTVDPLYDRVSSIFSWQDDSSGGFRMNVWKSVLAMIGDRPILGIGPGNDAFNKVYPFYQEAGYTALSAYSVFLEIIVETGFIGFICFLWILLVTLNHGWIQLQRLRQGGDRQGIWLIAAIATAVGMLAHGLVDTVWYRPQVSTVWWFTIALIASHCTPTRDKQANTSE
ncbi:MAG: IctB family putative bicarbonate transporter [Elainellaceae cyanobacterium]